MKQIDLRKIILGIIRGVRFVKVHRHTLSVFELLFVGEYVLSYNFRSILSKCNLIKVIVLECFIKYTWISLPHYAVILPFVIQNQFVYVCFKNKSLF